MRLRIAQGSAFRFDHAGASVEQAMRRISVAVAGLIARGVSLDAAVEAAIRGIPGAAGLVAYDPTAGGASFGLRRQHLFPDAPRPIDRFSFCRGETGSAVDLGDGDDAAGGVGRLLELCGSGTRDEREIRDGLDRSLLPVLDALIERGCVVPGEAPPVELAPRGVPGLIRLQHASVLLQSATTGILVDPHLHSSFEGSLERSVRRCDLEGRVDAILLSHSHRDHYDLSTLAMFSREIPIIVPRVERANLLCEDMAARLRSLGFRRVLDPPWYAPPVVVGDVEIHPLPFYGEQPLVDRPWREPGLRNWGNTYAVRTPQYSAWILIDSGDDVAGRAVDVAEHIRETWGGVDFVLSNLREFAAFTPLYITGAGQYWFALPPDVMESFAALAGSSLTLGPAGVAEACAAAGARRFLPYAHWWGELGTRGKGEIALVEALEQELRRRGASTAILPWRIGDFAASFDRCSG